ncbi:MAG: hypothetical protein ACREQW_13185 [Candidatus Binatia bacterium]
MATGGKLFEPLEQAAGDVCTDCTAAAGLAHTGMNPLSGSKLKPLLAYLVPVALISPSVLWIALDESVWHWDQAFYGRSSVELFHVLVHEPTDWISRMLDVLHWKAPGVAWLGQFFVPLGGLVGSIDVALMLSILVTQLLTLVFMYRSILELSSQDQLLAVTGCLLSVSGPLFIGMAHQYLTEPLQLLAVTWLVLIMSFAPKFNRAFLLSQLLAVTSVAMLAKVSSPLYCAGPGLLALWYVFRPEPVSLVKREYSKKRLMVTLAAGVLLSLGAVGWYYRNITYVMQHVAVASSGPIAEIYGKKDTFMSTMIYWLGAFQESFFPPSIFLLVSLVVVFAVTAYFIRPRPFSKHFTLCSAISAVQIITVLIVFSFSSNRAERYLLPLLPYVVVLICWALAQINKPVLVGLTAVFFLGQLAGTYGQALGFLRVVPTAAWLFPPDSDPKKATILNSIVSRTCTKTGSERYWTIIGIEQPWLNHESAAYFAAKSLSFDNRIGCHYGSVRDFSQSPEKIWNWILSAQIRYYVTMNPDPDPVAADSHSQALNRNYLPMLKKVRTSGLFDLEPPLPDAPGILIFRRREITPQSNIAK